MTPNDPRLGSQILICLGANKQAPQPPRKPYGDALAVSGRRKARASHRSRKKHVSARFRTLFDVYLSAEEEARFVPGFFFPALYFSRAKGKINSVSIAMLEFRVRESRV